MSDPIGGRKASQASARSVVRRLAGGAALLILVLVLIAGSVAEGQWFSVANPPVPPHTPTGSPVIYLPALPVDEPIPVRTLPGDEHIVQPSPPPFTPPPPLPMPTFLPPSEEWAVFTDPNTGISFEYPANWYVTVDDTNDVIYVTNWPFGLVYKDTDNPDRIKINVSLSPVDIRAYGSIRAYLNAPERRVPPGQLVSEEDLPLPRGYQGFRRVSLPWTGSKAQIVSIWVEKGGFVYGLVAFGNTHAWVTGPMAETLVLPEH